MKDKKYYQCTKCGRTFIYKIPHKCRGNLRKHHLEWKILNYMDNKKEQTINILSGCNAIKEA